MSRGTGLRVAVVGLGFGEHFLPIYTAHPDVSEIAIVDPSRERLIEIGEAFGIESRYERYEDMLADPRWDAVHVLAPVSFHFSYTIAALESGKHVACAVPMATELEHVAAIVETQKRTGLNYMLMETTVFSAEFRAIAGLHERGELGELSMYNGFHVQNLDGFPSYWRGYPPMKYATHALSPLLALTGDRVVDVVAYGSGRLTDDRRGQHVNDFPSEVGLFRLAESPVVADVTVSFFQTARPFREGYTFHGDRMAVEWPQDESLPPDVFTLVERGDSRPDAPRGGVTTKAPLELDHGHELLPPDLIRFTSGFQTVAHNSGEVRSYTADHGGSHPHLVHEFISSIMQRRTPVVGAVRAAIWSAPGICAHDSAMAGGERVIVPQF
ncbi:putative dehydrogenase [Homoserinimonas aerilata]|uniref:Putative dehydrogenase n=1 Tax=Homoserinimonas aerilata TaxID=1162970 RepID=A0A542XXG5_9MICO|nr:Gfo/Idh/MocA family oxidoreductase [Homoserinimonas aerilata]TQL40423.1 putative dehydrogenase [Homoserinimonas aerilata]